MTHKDKRADWPAEAEAALPELTTDDILTRDLKGDAPYAPTGTRSWLDEQERTLPLRWRIYSVISGRWLAVTETYWGIRNWLRGIFPP